MNAHAIPRKPRKNPLIKKTSPLFSQYVREGDHESAAVIAFLTALSILGVDGIMGALDNANNFTKRSARKLCPLGRRGSAVTDH